MRLTEMKPWECQFWDGDGNLLCGETVMATDQRDAEQKALETESAFQAHRWIERGVAGVHCVTQPVVVVS